MPKNLISKRKCACTENSICAYHHSDPRGKGCPIDYCEYCGGVGEIVSRSTRYMPDWCPKCGGSGKEPEDGEENNSN